MVDAGAVADPMAPSKRQKGMGRWKIKAMEAVTQHGGSQRFKQGEDDDFAPAGPQGGQFEIPPHAKGDEGEGHIGDKLHVLYNLAGDQVQYVGPDQHAGQDVAGDVGQAQFFGDPGDDKPGE